MSGGSDTPGLSAQEIDLKLALLKDIGDECLLIYQLAVRKGFLSPDDLAEVALPPARQDQCLLALASLGLVREAGGRAGFYVITHPEDVAMQLLEPVTAQANAAQRHVERLRGIIGDWLSPFREAVACASRADSVVILSNTDSVQWMLAAEAERCAGELLCVHPLSEPDALVHGEFGAALDAILKRGVTMRSVFPLLALESKEFQCRIKRLAELGTEVRVCDEIRGGLTIFDGSVAFITRPPGALPRGGTAIIREPTLVTYLADIFEFAWSAGTQFWPAAGEDESTVLGRAATALRPIEQAIIELMSAGLKDEVIARKLGISVRTCRSHIAHLIEYLGAQSRFQAGVYAAGTGIVPLDHEKPAKTPGQGNGCGTR